MQSTITPYHATHAYRITRPEWCANGLTAGDIVTVAVTFAGHDSCIEIRGIGIPPELTDQTWRAEVWTVGGVVTSAQVVARIGYTERAITHDIELARDPKHPGYVDLNDPGLVAAYCVALMADRIATQEALESQLDCDMEPVEVEPAVA